MTVDVFHIHLQVLIIIYFNQATVSSFRKRLWETPFDRETKGMQLLFKELNFPCTGEEL